MHLSTRSICKNTFTKSTFITTMQLRVSVSVRAVRIQFGLRCSGMTAWLPQRTNTLSAYCFTFIHQPYLKRLVADSGGRSLTLTICSAHQALEEHLLSLRPLGSNADAPGWRPNGSTNPEQWRPGNNIQQSTIFHITPNRALENREHHGG